VKTSTFRPIKAIIFPKESLDIASTHLKYHNKDIDDIKIAKKQKIIIKQRLLKAIEKESTK
jgi:hypothetical protein